MTAAVIFTCAGQPRAQGSMKHVGRGRLIHSPLLVQWRLDIKSAAAAEMQSRPPMQGPVELHATFDLPRPKSVRVKDRMLPWRKPDLDKLLRAVFDSISGTVITDDAQIVHVECSKRYADDGPAGVTVFVTAVQ